MEENSHILIQNVMKLKKTDKYAQFANAHQESFRTLNGFIKVHLKKIGITKEELAKRLGTSNQILNRWERQGIPQMENALELAIALELKLDEMNEFLLKYAGFRDLASAYEEHFTYICIILNQEMIKQGYPRKETETIRAWIKRITDEVGKIFLEQKVPGKIVSEHALQYLEKYVRGSRFEKNSGNQSEFQGDVWKFDLILNEDRKRYQWICRCIREEKIPNKDELIALGLMLRMTKKELDEFLKESGHYPLSAKDIYEGALIMVLTNLERVYPEQFYLEMFYDKPFGLRIAINQQIEKCLKGLPTSWKDHLKERPMWYEPEKNPFLKEKQRMAAILLDMEKHMRNTWILIGDNREVSVEDRESLLEYINLSLEFAGYKKLQEDKEQELLKEIQRVETLWKEFLKKEGIYDVSITEFRELYTAWMGRVVNAYLVKYAPKMKEKGKKTDEI